MTEITVHDEKKISLGLKRLLKRERIRFELSNALPPISIKRTRKHKRSGIAVKSGGLSSKYVRILTHKEHKEVHNGL